MKNPGLFKAFLGISLVLALQACNLPSNTPTPTAESSAPASGQPAAAPGADACSNSLYPVVSGASWTYSVTGLANDSFTHSITDVRPDGFTDQDVFASGATRSGEWKCDNGALIALSPLTGPSAAVTANNMTATFQTTGMSGVTLPATVHSGDTWMQDFDVQGTQSVGGQDVAAQGKVAFECTAGATESTTVAAGSFDAQRVDCKINLNISVSIGGPPGPHQLLRRYDHVVWPRCWLGQDGRLDSEYRQRLRRADRLYHPVSADDAGLARCRPRVVRGKQAASRADRCRAGGRSAGACSRPPPHAFPAFAFRRLILYTKLEYYSSQLAARRFHDESGWPVD